MVNSDIRTYRVPESGNRLIPVPVGHCPGKVGCRSCLATTLPFVAISLQHPASLNLWQRFRQARAVLRDTSRARNAAWYQDATELDLQLHIRVDGTSVTTFVYHRANDRWWQGPDFDAASLVDPARMDGTAVETLKLARAEKAAALGVILHLADEFATAELKPELDNPAALPDLRDAAVMDPLSILDDSSTPPEQNAWRVLPYPAAGSEAIATTVTVSRQYAPFFEILRQTAESNNFPLVGVALSTPLVATMGLAAHLPLTSGKPFVAILQYPWFTVLEFFNEHHDLRLIRTLQHRQQQRAANLRSALTITNASLELTDPDVFIVPLAREPDPGVLAELSSALPGSRVAVVALPAPDGLAAWCPEPLIAATPPPAGDKPPSLTFDILRNEQWALQDFLPIPREIAEIYPVRSELRLLRLLQISRVAAFAVVVLIFAWFALGIYDVLKRREWAFDPREGEVTNRSLVMLGVERERIENWGNLLEDRSKAWTSMELLSRLFPERCGVLVKNFAHTVRPDQAPGMASIGFVKEWKIGGMARDEAVDLLNELNTQDGINARFAEIARLTENSAFDPVLGNRSLTVNIRTQDNGSFKPLPLEEITELDESTYPFAFDLTIVQRFEASDPMALNVSKPKPKSKPKVK